MWRDTPGRLSGTVDKGCILPMLLLERSETGKSNNLCSSLDSHLKLVLSQELRPKV